MKYFCLVVALAFSLPLMAQQQSPQEQEKMLRENIEESLEKYERTLELEYWQVFYMDSILTHDYGAMMAEMEEKSKAKVESSDIYQQIQDKWSEQMYLAIHKILNEQQWEKYLKQAPHARRKPGTKERTKGNK